MSTPEDQPTSVRIRRAPKFSVFLVVGAVVGALVTLVVTSLQPADPAIGFAALFGYFAIYGVAAGVTIGAVLAIVFDRLASRRAHTVSAVRELPGDDER